MNELPSDALVFFGATGDLAYKKIFPSLQAMVKHGVLNVPVIGVARAAGPSSNCRRGARDRRDYYGGLDQPAFDKLLGLLRYIDGDYSDPATFQALKKALGGAQRPAHYLAIPPVLFGAVVGAVDEGGLCAHRRPRGRREAFRPRPRVRPATDQILLSTFDEDHIFRIDHYLGKRPVHNMLFFPLHQPVVRVALESHLRRKRADHDGRELRRGGTRLVL